MSPLMARMGWNPDSPTNALRVSLLAYLRAQLRQLEKRPKDAALEAGLAQSRRALEGPDYAASEINDLRRWIAWLDGAEVST